MNNKNKGKKMLTMEKSDDLYESVDMSPEHQDQVTLMKNDRQRLHPQPVHPERHQQQL